MMLKVAIPGFLSSLIKIKVVVVIDKHNEFSVCDKCISVESKKKKNMKGGEK